MTTGRTLSVHVPLMRKRSGARKLVVAPESGQAPDRPADQELVRLLARAFRWRRLIEMGTCCTIEELATAEAVNPSLPAGSCA